MLTDLLTLNTWKTPLFMLIELAEMGKLTVFGCLDKYLFTLFCFELRKAQKSHCVAGTSWCSLDDFCSRIFICLKFQIFQLILGLRFMYWSQNIVKSAAFALILGWYWSLIMKEHITSKIQGGDLKISSYFEAS